VALLLSLAMKIDALDFVVVDLVNPVATMSNSPGVVVCVRHVNWGNCPLQSLKDCGWMGDQEVDFSA